MIIQELCGYYDRKAAFDSESIAPPGFQHKEIPFVIALNAQGDFKQIQDIRETDAKGRKRAVPRLVPQEIKRSGKNAWQTANLFWDKVDYVLGYSSDPAKQDIAIKSHQCFMDRIQTLPPEVLNLPSVKAVLTFLHDIPLQVVQQDPNWKEIEKTAGALLTFRVGLQPETICEEPAVFAALQRICQGNNSIEQAQGMCLVTGRRDEIERLHPAIKGVIGCQTAGANIVSFNLDAFNSYGKTQGYNAPVGKRAAFAYTTALNTLLSKDSKQKIQLAGTTVVFWAERPTQRAEDLENMLTLSFNQNNYDDPDAGVKAVQTFYNSPWKGKALTPDDESNRFFVLGLSPNAARIAIRFWYTFPFDKLEKNILKHFEDLQLIVNSEKESGYLPITRLMKSLALRGDRKNLPSNIEGEFFQTILLGQPYPWKILEMALDRMYAEVDNPLPFARVSLIKAFLNRWYCSHPYLKEEEFNMSLDETNRNTGYCLGRLFAVLVRIQEKSEEREKNRSLYESYFSAAATTPAAILNKIIYKLTPHHLKKMKRSPKLYGLAITLEKTLGQVMDLIQNQFPPRLKLCDQGAFAVGYYHQRQKFFTKSEQSENLSDETMEIQE